MKKTLLVLFSVFLGVALFAPQSASAAVRRQAQKDYDYELIDQQPRGMLTMQAGEIKRIWIEVKNTGTKTWYAAGSNPVRLGGGSLYESGCEIMCPIPNYNNLYPAYNYDYQHHQSNDFAYFDDNPGRDSWLSGNRTSFMSNGNSIIPEIKPGWHTRFQFKIKAPQTIGMYKTYFTPVVEGVEWMKDIGIYWEITVAGLVNPQVISVNSGDIASVKIGDHIVAITSANDTNLFNYDATILKYLWTGAHCDNPAPYTGGSPICNSLITQHDGYFEVIGDGFSKIEKGDFSANVVVGRDYYLYDSYDGNYTLENLNNAKTGDIIIVKLPGFGDGGYSTLDPEFYDWKIRLVDHKYFAPDLGAPLGDSGSDQWAFEVLDATTSPNFIMIRASQPWKGGDTFTAFRLNINYTAPL